MFQCSRTFQLEDCLNVEGKVQRTSTVTFFIIASGIISFQVKHHTFTVTMKYKVTQSCHLLATFLQRFEHKVFMTV